MQKEEKDSLIIDTKKLRMIIDRFDGAALHTMRKLTTEERTLFKEYIDSLGAPGGSPGSRPSITKEERKT